MTTAKGILEEAKKKGQASGIIADAYKYLKEKTEIGKKLESSLIEGIARAEYVLSRYAEVFNEKVLSDHNQRKLPLSDQITVAYWKRRRKDQEAMLLTVQSKLTVDKRSLESYETNAKGIDEIVQNLYRYLEETVAVYQSLIDHKKSLEDEQIRLFKENQSLSDDCKRIREEFVELGRRKDEL